MTEEKSQLENLKRKKLENEISDLTPQQEETQQLTVQYYDQKDELDSFREEASILRGKREKLADLLQCGEALESNLKK